MKNVERFNLYAVHLFGIFYERFPIATGIDEIEIVKALKLPPQTTTNSSPESEENKLVSQTLQWLVDTNYLIMRESGSHVKRYVLAPKALEALNTTMSALEGKKPEPEEQSVGTKLAAAASIAGKEAAKEGWKQFAGQAIGQIIGHAFKAAFTTP